MKATLFMATSANGFVARRDGDEDFLPHDGWIQMMKFVKEYDHLIWGRKTYEEVMSWDGDFAGDLKNIPIIVVSKNIKSYNESNVTVCQSPEEAVNLAKNRGYKKAFLSGGPSLNTSFVKAGLIDEIIINYNPTILADGIKLFKESDFEIRLKLKDIKKLSPDVVQLHYLVDEILIDKSAE